MISKEILEIKKQFTPVSYTHLDVYKRQAETIPRRLQPGGQNCGTDGSKRHRRTCRRKQKETGADDRGRACGSEKRNGGFKRRINEHLYGNTGLSEKL